MHKAEKYAFDMKRLSKDDASAIRSFCMQNFGCARKVYNLYVDYLYNKLEEVGYTSGAEIPSFKIPEVTAFKKQYPYLKLLLIPSLLPMQSRTSRVLLSVTTNSLIIKAIRSVP